MDLTETKIHAHAFNLIPQLGPVKLAKLFSRFPDLRQAWQAEASQLTRCGLEPKLVELIIAKRKEIDPPAAYEKLERSAVRVLLKNEKHYPALLKEIDSPPPLLYVRGREELLNRPGIAVVGSRKMTLYGRQAITEIVPTLSQAGLSVVSGLAFGVDAESLQTCLKEQGAAIAILATAIDDSSISPRANFNLAQKIIAHGCLVSEYPPGLSVQKQNFPIRNRLIAAVSIGTLVVEADEESGALITAKYALDYNREVFAVPGSIFSVFSRGTNRLIAQGATMVSNGSDIIRQFNLDTKPYSSELAPGQETDENERAVITLLGKEPVHLDDLVKQLGRPAAEINSLLTMLEIRGRIKNYGGSKYAKIR